MRTVVVGAVKSTEVAILRLISAGSPPELIVTAPVSKKNMHSDFVDLSMIAHQHNIPLLEELDVNSQHCLDTVRAISPDYIFVIGWSRLCGKQFRELASNGVIGYHPTLLPQMRGRAALAWTIILNTTTTGATLFWMDEGVDSGDIAVQHSMEFAQNGYLGELITAQMELLEGMMDELLIALKAGQKPALRQDHTQASYLAIRTPSDGIIDWELDAKEIARLIRAISRPYPGAFSFSGKDTIRIWRARETDHSHWHALTGQVFTYENGQPVVRCGGHTSLLLEDYQIENALGEVLISKRLIGQKRMQSIQHV